MKIQVTQQDIDNGLKGLCTHCPVALAFKRVIQGGSVEVGDAAYIFPYNFDGPTVMITLPEFVHKFIRAFDSGNKVEPFEFECEVDKRCEWIK